MIFVVILSYFINFFEMVLEVSRILGCVFLKEFYLFVLVFFIVKERGLRYRDLGFCVGV